MIPLTNMNHYNSEDSDPSESSSTLSLTVAELKETLRTLPDGRILNIPLTPMADSGGNSNGKV